MANRFEQVDEEQDDALNLVLSQTSQGQVGSVRIHADTMAGRAPGGVDSGELAARDAFRAAIRLANEMKLPVVVVDPDNVWDAAWGELYRDDEDESDAPVN
ncbi:MAG: hypothetical protein IPL88_14335 [Rhizobiales bacterium]|nr:hypothetical protein [Hyphomicrobiales bacterium]